MGDDHKMCLRVYITILYLGVHTVYSHNSKITMFWYSCNIFNKIIEIKERPLTAVTFDVNELKMNEETKFSIVLTW